MVAPVGAWGARLGCQRGIGDRGDEPRIYAARLRQFASDVRRLRHGRLLAYRPDKESRSERPGTASLISIHAGTFLVPKPRAGVTASRAAGAVRLWRGTRRNARRAAGDHCRMQMRGPWRPPRRPRRSASWAGPTDSGSASRTPTTAAASSSPGDGPGGLA